MAGEIGDVISGKLAVPEGKTRIFKSLGKLLWAVEESEVKYSQINRVGAGAKSHTHSQFKLEKLVNTVQV